MDQTYKYKTFISYSHKDKAFAKWLHRRIENYKIPKSLREKYPHLPKDLKRSIFRDEEELPTSSVLSNNLTYALDHSELLIVICSPWAATSKWVNKEIAYYKNKHGEHTVLAIIKSGEPNATYTNDAKNEAFPESLRYIVGEDEILTSQRSEPLAADASSYWKREMALVKMIAGILKVDFADLWGREKRERKKRRVITTAIISVFVGLVFYAFTQFAGKKLNVEFESLGKQIASIEYSIRHDDLPMEKVITLNDELEELRKQKEEKEDTLKSFGALKSSLGKRANETYLDKGAKAAIKVLTSRYALSEKEKLKKEFSLEDITLAKLYVETNEYDNAEKSYEDAISIFFDYDNVMNYGSFLIKQNYHKKALTLFEKLKEMNLSEAKKAKILHILGNIYKDLDQSKQAMGVQKEALEIYRGLVKKNPEKYNSHLAETLIKLGSLYNNNSQLKKAEDTLNEALELMRILNENKPGEYKSGMASASAYLGIVYSHSSNPRLKKAEKSYTEALKLYRILAEENPQEYKIYEGRILNAFGLFYKDTRQKEKYYSEALEIYRGLAKLNPRAYNTDVANLLDTLGSLYKYDKQTKQAENAYLEALQIRKTFAKTNPEVYSSDVASTLRSLGNFYYNSRKFKKAENAYVEALDMYWNLSKDNPNTFKDDLAQTLKDLGKFYTEVQQFKKAEDAYVESVKLYRDLVQSDAKQYNIDLAWALSALGKHYELSNKNKQAESSYVESLELFQSLVDSTAQVSEADVAARYSLLGYFYLKKIKDLTKAYDSFTRSLEIYRILARSKPNTYLQNVAMELNSLSFIFQSKKQMKKAEKFSLEAMEIYRTLVKLYTNMYTPRLVETISVLGNIYIQTGQLEKAENSYLEALDIYRTLAQVDPETYNEKIASSLGNLGKIYFQNSQMKKAKVALAEALGIYKVLLIKKPGKYNVIYALTLMMNLSFSSQPKEDLKEIEKILIQHQEDPLAKFIIDELKAIK